MNVVETMHPIDRGPLSLEQWAVLGYADAMTKNVVIDDVVFDAPDAGWIQPQGNCRADRYDSSL